MHIKLGGLSIFRVIIWLFNTEETILSDPSCQFMMIFIINLKILSDNTCSNFQHTFFIPFWLPFFNFPHIYIFTVHKIVYFTSIFQINIYVTLEEERHQITKSREELWARVCNWRALDLRTSFTQLVKTTFRVGILIKFRLGCKMSELDGWKWAPN